MKKSLIVWKKPLSLEIPQLDLRSAFLSNQTEEHVSNKIQQIGQWDLENLTCTYYKPNILIKIKDIGFPNLHELELRENSIVSVQAISSLFAPKIKILFLGKNLITSVKSLRKTNFPLVQNIDIDENYITDAENLSQMLLSKQMFEFDLEWIDCHEMCCDIRWLMKFPITKMKFFQIYSHQRINQKETRQQLKQKIKGLSILS